MKYILVFCILLGAASAFEWKTSDVPNPLKNPPAFCGLKDMPDVSLCDVEGILTMKDNPRIAEKIMEKQRFLAGYGKCACEGNCQSGKAGLHVGFLILDDYKYDSKNKHSTELNPTSLNEFSDEVHKNWNFGLCNNSILITIATGRKQFGYSIGKTVEHGLNETWISSILIENLKDRRTQNLNFKMIDILSLFEQVIREDLAASSITDPNYPQPTSPSTSIFDIMMYLIALIIIIAFVSIILFLILRHRKENDDVSLRDVWTKKFWLKAGNQYREAKQSESGNEKDIEKNEEVKAKLASVEDLKPTEDIEKVDIEYPPQGKFSKV